MSPASILSAAPVAFPSEWELDAVLTDGAVVHLRPIRATDADAHRAFFTALSRDTVYQRFFVYRHELSDAEVARFTTVDFIDRMAFVVTLRDDIIGVGRYDRLAASATAEVAFVVADGHQGRGISSLLLEYLAAYARDHGITRFVADTFATNRRMLDVFHHAGFHREPSRRDGSVVSVAFDIEPTGDSLLASERRAWTAGVTSIGRILCPRSIAVVGAGRTRGSIGNAVLRNLVDGGFTGAVYPVNPLASSVEGLAAYPTVDAIPGDVDIAVIAIPAALCAEVVDACARKEVGGLVVISSGFAEIGEAGVELQRDLLRRAHRGGMRVVGPNCFGVINTAPTVRMDATFASMVPNAGHIAVASQSGALGIAVLERSVSAGLGVSGFVSMGNKADVSSNDLLRYWSQDGITRAILLYLESFGNARMFARVAPEVARRTPIVAVKSGRSDAGRRAAASHTAALASADVATDALFRQAGVIRVDTLEEMLDTGSVLEQDARVVGNRLLILGNAGGAAVLAADACASADLDVPVLGPAEQAELRARAGPNAGIANPVDLGAGATPGLFADALRVATRTAGLDAILIILAPVAGLDSDEVVRAVAAVDVGNRPLLFVTLGADRMPAALREGARVIPGFAFPERAVHALGRLARHARWRERPRGSVPTLTGVDLDGSQAVVMRFLARVPEGGWLPPDDVRALLASAGIPTVAEAVVPSATAAVAAARDLGFPCVLKAAGPGIVHKSELGAVRLDLRTPADVRRAWRELRTTLGPLMRGGVVQPMHRGVETIAGVVADQTFGPLVMFGSGGTAVEMFGDRAFRILPLTDVDACELVMSTRGSVLLRGFRGSAPCDVAAVEQVLLRIGWLADSVPQVAEMDLNPLMATPRGAVAVDSRVRVVPWQHRAEDDVRHLR